MSETKRHLYVANLWDSMFTRTAMQHLEDRGWKVDGNWLNHANLSPLHKVIIASPADFNDPVVFRPIDMPGSRVFTYLIYPDQLVGYDFTTNKFKSEQKQEFVPLLEEGTILSESTHVLELVSSVYGTRLNSNRRVTYLPIEYEEIHKVKMEGQSHMSRPIRVLWSHMWRKDKGFDEALVLIDQLSKAYRGVEFWIARNETWGNDPLKNAETKARLKQLTAPLLTQLRTRNNVFFQDNFCYKDAYKYWQFLSNMDIGFSVSHHEGFGLGMLEQAAAGVACIMPNRESYPEVDRGGLITDNVGEAISRLIEDGPRRNEISQACEYNASRFNANKWAENILGIIQ